MDLGNVLIFGDSYSTFKDWIPEGYACYYYPERDCDVRSVEDTWWHQAISRGNGHLIENNSWSGSTIGYRGYNGADVSHLSSFIYRLRQHLENGFFEKNKIDTFIIFGGTNDSWCGAPLGEIMYEGHTEEDLYNVLPAFSYLFKTVTEKLPNIRVICLINCDIKEAVMDGLETIVKHFGVEYIRFTEIDKYRNHPTKKGMSQICDAVLQRFED